LGLLRLSGLATLRAGGKRALAQALAALESRPEDPAVQALLDEAWDAQTGVSVGLTGPPGVGKSTLANALVKAVRVRGQSVAVAAVDPSSRTSGGAILGDRARIDADPADQQVFVRSFAARDRLGGLADLAAPASVLFRALFDWTIIETVGVGQSETEIVDLADLVLFCAQPSSGDALQFMKAGVMEIPDLAVVTKADLGPPARRAAADLRAALALAVRDGDPPSVMTCSANTGEGVNSVVEALADRAQALHGPRLTAKRRAQGEAWVAQSLKARFGREGYNWLGDATRLLWSETPFARERAAVALIRGIAFNER
jgi:LAO/AO transport system kinase